MNTDPKLTKLKELLNLLDESLTRKEFEDAFSAVVEYVKKIDANTKTELETIKNIANSAISRIQSLTSDNLSTLENTLRLEAEQAINDLRFQHEALVAEAQKKLDEVRNGEDADEDEIIERVLGQIPEPKEKEDETPESLRDKLEELEGDDRLSVTAIKGMDEYDKKLAEASAQRGVPGSSGVALTVGGVYIGEVRDMIMTGTAVAKSVDAHGRVILTFTGGSGSGSTQVETPTGDVDGVNTSYTVANTPLYIIVDGISKFETLHYTYGAGTITVTDGAIPTQYIRSVFSA
jgi:hypothetical protein